MTNGIRHLSGMIKKKRENIEISMAESTSPGMCRRHQQQRVVKTPRRTGGKTVTLQSVIFNTLHSTHLLCLTSNEVYHLPDLMYNLQAVVNLLLAATLPIPSKRSAHNEYVD
jgi:hypothetical protein